MLTDKAEFDFNIWLRKQEDMPPRFYQQSFNSQIGWILDWLDTVQLYVDIMPTFDSANENNFCYFESWVNGRQMLI